MNGFGWENLRNILRAVFGGGADISAANPLEVHDPKVGSLISYEGTTTADGAPAGATLVCADLTTKPDFDGQWVVITSGPYEGQCSDITGPTIGGTVTVHEAFDGQIITGTKFVILAMKALPAEVAAIKTVVDNILLDSQVRTIQSGVKVIDAGITKYLHIDSGTNGAEILSIVIEGVLEHDWTLDVYVPAADGEAATQAKSKRDTIPYLVADTKGGLLQPFGIPFDCYLDFTNDGANDQIDQVTITYRSRGVLTLTWEA